MLAADKAACYQSFGALRTRYRMSSTSANTPIGATIEKAINRVPEVTLYFWIIKILATTVGETAADYLNTTLNFGLSKTTYVMSALLAIALIVQFALKRYVPAVYWLAVVLISVVGTLITDNLTDHLGISLYTTTAVFSAALALTFLAWFISEHTLSIHTIHTARRESFYWLTVLFTFSLGTAAGDLVAEKMAVGYLASAVIFAVAIAIIYGSHLVLRLNAVFAFWIAYILTRPLGASIGDELSQTKGHGGLGLGTTVTSFIFLAVIALVVSFLSITRLDREATIIDAEGEHGEFEYHDGKFHPALPHLGPDHPHDDE